MTAPAERLRAAADLIERTGAAATPGPWWVAPTERGDVFAGDWRVADTWPGVGLHPESEVSVLANAAWIALLGPDTAPHLAMWLNTQADHVDLRGTDCMCCDAAVAFADLILRGEP